MLLIGTDLRSHRRRRRSAHSGPNVLLKAQRGRDHDRPGAHDKAIVLLAARRRARRRAILVDQQFGAGLWSGVMHRLTVVRTAACIQDPARIARVTAVVDRMDNPIGQPIALLVGLSGTRHPASVWNSRPISRGWPSLPPAALGGSTYQTPVPAAAVAPEVPQNPLSASTTRAPRCAALTAAQVPAGPPPMTRTSASYSTDPGGADVLSAREGRVVMARFSVAESFAAAHGAASISLPGSMRLVISDICADLDEASSTAID